MYFDVIVNYFQHYTAKSVIEFDAYHRMDLSNRDSKSYEHIDLVVSNGILKHRTINTPNISGTSRYPSYSGSTNINKRKQPEGCPTGVCFSWFESKKCQRGNECRWKHPHDSNNDTYTYNNNNSNFKRTRFQN